MCAAGAIPVFIGHIVDRVSLAIFNVGIIARGNAFPIDGDRRLSRFDSVRQLVPAKIEINEIGVGICIIIEFKLCNNRRQLHQRLRQWSAIINSMMKGSQINGVSSAFAMHRWMRSAESKLEPET